MAPQDNPLGLPKLDSAVDIDRPSIDDYVSAASEYVLRSSQLDAGAKKAAQIRLSALLARVLAKDLAASIPSPTDFFVGERQVSGALRNVQADVSEIHPLDGLRLAIELKPVNLAVGRAIWNRFGDVRTFAVNLHLKFPFAVIGGVLTVPTVEFTSDGGSKSTVHLIERAVKRFVRAGGRRNEAEAPHLLESVSVLVYDPNTSQIVQDLPEPGSGLRWDEFVHEMALAYESRFSE